MTIRVGLTGSMGTGKSTTATLFAEAGCGIWDADAVVAKLYAKGGKAVNRIQQQFPTVMMEGEVSRERLRTLTEQDSKALEAIEKIVHPLVAEDRQAFLHTTNKLIAVMEIPLLFENGLESEMDFVVCTAIDATTRSHRLQSRETMTARQIELLLSKQLTEQKKIDRSDFVVVTNTIDNARAQVAGIVQQIKEDYKRCER
ncbi:MAG: dephospho-CoA kinase [Aestuariivita sp.]|nr:dephospho-CoA kinase [Aestuariivita sp.]MCY4202572.1 dephospho-CoA kinase [Aestuariivita sp.]